MKVVVFCLHLLRTGKKLKVPTSSLEFAVPVWAVGAIVVLVLLLVAAFIFCVFKKCFGKKKKPKKVRERKAGRRRKEKEGEGEAGEKVCVLVIAERIHIHGAAALVKRCCLSDRRAR